MQLMTAKIAIALPKILISPEYGSNSNLTFFTLAQNQKHAIQNDNRAISH